MIYIIIIGILFKNQLIEFVRFDYGFMSYSEIIILFDINEF